MKSIHEEILETLSGAAGQYVWGIDKAFAKLCNSLAYPIVVTTTDLEAPGPTILFANNAFLEMCDYEFADVVGQSPRVLQGQETDHQRTARFRDDLAQKGRARMKILNYKSNGEPYGVDVVAHRLRASEPHSDVMLAAEMQIPVKEALE